MKKISLLIAILLVSFNLNAQCFSCGMPANPDIAVADFNREFAASQAMNTTQAQVVNSNIEGFKTATIALNGNEKVYLSRYNPISNEMEIKGEDGLVYNLRKFIGLKITFVDSKESYQAVTFKDTYGQTVIDFFNVPSAQNDILLKQTSLSFVEAKKAKTGYDNDKPAFYKEKTEYYFVDNDNYLVNLTTKKKDVKSLYKTYSKEILVYIKKNKIKSSREDDLIKLATFMKILQSNSQETRLANN